MTACGSNQARGPLAVRIALAAVWLVAAASPGFCSATEPRSSLSAGQPYAEISAVLTQQEVLDSRERQHQPFRLAELPHALVFEMTDLREQAKTFGRIATFVEKSGAPKARVLGDAEFAQWLARSGQQFELLTLGNDFGVDELARFYNTVQLQRLPLSEREQWLLGELERTGLFSKGRLGWEIPNPQAIVLSFPAVSRIEGCARCSVTATTRLSIFGHEYGHALYSGDVFLQHYTDWFWSNRMPLTLKSLVQRFLSTRGYDTARHELVLKEFYAFLFHSDDLALFNPAEWGLNQQGFAALREQFASALR